MVHPPEKWTSAEKAGATDDAYIHTIESRITEWEHTRNKLKEESPGDAKLAEEIRISLDAVRTNLKNLRAAPSASRKNIKTRIEAMFDGIRRNAERAMAE